VAAGRRRRHGFWDEIAAESETKAKVVEIFKKYNADMQRPGGLTATADPGAATVGRGASRCPGFFVTVRNLKKDATRC
jgi:hypothetical protein